MDNTSTATTATATTTVAYRCTTCWKENLAAGLICKRSSINSWNEGTCLRCCDHNHG